MLQHDSRYNAIIFDLNFYYNIEHIWVACLPVPMLSNRYLNDQDLIEADIKIDSLIIKCEIGRGNSLVYAGLLDGREVAIKRAQIHSDYEYQCFLQEISALRVLSGKSSAIIAYEGYFVMNSTSKQRRFKNARYGYLCMEKGLCNLAEFVKQRKQDCCTLKKQQIMDVIGCLLDGFSVLESMKIAHCDIKPENILVTCEKRLQVKICDVGSSKLINNDEKDEKTIKGTLSFLAPELIKIQQMKITSVNPFRSDVYSFGLVLLFLISGRKFTYKERKQIKEDVYFQIISQWIRYCAQLMANDEQILQVLSKALQRQPFKRCLFSELKKIYDYHGKKKKVLLENKIQRLHKIKSQSENFGSRPEERYKKLPQVNTFASSTLLSFNSRQKLTSKFTVTNLRNKLNQSKEQSKRSRDKSINKKSGQKSSSKISSPFQKATMYSTFSVNKSNVSIRDSSKTIIHVTKQNANVLPFDLFDQDEKIFVLYTPSIMFESALTVVIKGQCGVQIFDKLCNVKNGSNLYVEYNNINIYGIDENTSTVNSFDSVHISLVNSCMEGGYNNFLRCLCPIKLKNLTLVLTGSEVSFPELRMQLERIKNKQLSRFQLVWDSNVAITAEQFAELNEKISKLSVRKLSLSMCSSFLSGGGKTRWPLPIKAKCIYLNFPNNQLQLLTGSLGVSLAGMGELKQLYLNLENNGLSDTDIKFIVKSLSTCNSLQKLVLNFNSNIIQKGLYCFEQLAQMHKLSALELRIAGCQISINEFFQIYGNLVELFSKNLSILKISYDRNILQNIFTTNLENSIIIKNLKLDLVRYSSYFMVYVKKKKLGGQKVTKIKSKNSQNDSELNEGEAKIESTTSLNMPKVVFPSSAARHKQKKTDLSTVTTIKVGNQEKEATGNRICEALYTSMSTYECYICLGCCETRQMAKQQYFCRACIENCEHKGHNIVKTYEKRTCNCPFNYNCCFRTDENCEFVCADKLGIKYKSEFECGRCSPGVSQCEGCITQCRAGHEEFVERRPSTFFTCQKQNPLQ